MDTNKFNQLSESEIDTLPPGESDGLAFLTNREITNKEIAAAAYERYLARGGEDGHDVEDWLAAEQCLRQYTVPERRMGGQELPDELQDRPEQNAGYDAAVRGGAPATDVNWDGDAADDAGALETLGEGFRVRPQSDRVAHHVVADAHHPERQTR